MHSDDTPLTLTALVHESHQTAVSKGWWEDGDRNVGEMLCLMHAEISEALEEWRARHPLTEIRIENGKPEGVPVELADVMIRIGDFCGRYNIDLEAAVKQKLAFNKTRSHRHGNKLA